MLYTERGIIKYTRTSTGVGLGWASISCSYTLSREDWIANQHRQWGKARCSQQVYDSSETNMLEVHEDRLWTPYLIVHSYFPRFLMAEQTELHQGTHGPSHRAASGSSWTLTRSCVRELIVPPSEMHLGAYGFYTFMTGVSCSKELCGLMAELLECSFSRFCRKPLLFRPSRITVLLVARVTWVL